MDPGDPDTLYAAAYRRAARRLRRRQPGPAVQRRRRPLQDDRRRQDVEAPDEGPARPPLRPLRPERLPQGPARRLRRRFNRQDRHPQRARPAAEDRRRPRDRRRLPLRRPRRDLGQGQRPLPAAVLLRPDPRRSQRRPARLRRRRRRCSRRPTAARRSATTPAPAPTATTTPSGSTPPTPTTWSSAPTAASISATTAAPTGEHLENLPIGQFYAIGLDMRKPYRVYGGLQDNGSWGGPSRTRSPDGITVADWFKHLRGRRLLLPARPRRPRHRLLRGASTAFLRRINVRLGGEADVAPQAADRRRAGLPLQLGFADPDLAARLEDDLLWRQFRLQVGQPRRQVGRDQPRRDARQAGTERRPRPHHHRPWPSRR